MPISIAKYSGILQLLILLQFLASQVLPKSQPGISSAGKQSNTIFFTENIGQWNSEMHYRAETSGATIWFAEGSVYYQLTRESNFKKGNLKLNRKRHGIAEDILETKLITVSFDNANPHPNIRPAGPLEFRSNYLIGNDPADWRVDVSNYETVTYENLYNGIDLRYYRASNSIEYDFIAAPDADYSQIRVSIDGAENISIDTDGRLLIDTEWGIISESSPIIYQYSGKNKNPITGKFKLYDNNRIGFELTSEYDKSKALIIDPTLSYSSYLGGGSIDIGNSVAVDAGGNVYIVGRTSSSDFPNVGPYQTYQASYDAFVTKMSADGSAPIYSTYIGGSSYDEALDVAVDADGNAYITGYTRSTNYPVANQYQTDQTGADIFVTKLNSSGDGLIYSTYIGGDGDDIGYALVIDDNDYAYLTGTTISSNFPTVTPYQLNQPYYDAFITKVNTTGDNLIFSSYFGGDQDDAGYDIALDADGDIYLTGETFSSDLPTLSPYQTDQPLGDAFLTKIAGAGNSLIYSTYLGGGDDDVAYGLAVHSDKTACLTGGTASTNFPIQNEYQTDQTGDDVFITKFNANGDNLVYSTYMGGTGDETANAIDIDASGSIYITGESSNDNFPVKGSLQTYQGGIDIFVTKLNSLGSDLDFSTYLGGSADEMSYGIDVDANSSTYITGYTFSTDYTTLNPYQTDLVQADAFITKIDIGAFVCGDANGDEDVNILDIVYIINYKYKGGPAPEPLEAADVDGQPDVNILDIVYLINYKYKGGPAPNC